MCSRMRSAVEYRYFEFFSIYGISSSFKLAKISFSSAFQPNFLNLMARLLEFAPKPLGVNGPNKFS